MFGTCHNSRVQSRTVAGRSRGDTRPPSATEQPGETWHHELTSRPRPPFYQWRGGNMHLAVLMIAASAAAAEPVPAWVGRVLLAVNEEAAAPAGKADTTPEAQD